MEESGLTSEKSSGITVQICEPQKIGDGISAFIQYKVVTSAVGEDGSALVTGTVVRRFKEFFILFQYLTKLYVPQGYIVVKPPERNAAAMTRFKLLDGNESKSHICERTYRLETFINTIVSHKVLGRDEGVYFFLHESMWEPKLKINPKKGAFDDLVDRFEDIFPVSLDLGSFDEWFVSSMNDCNNVYEKLELLRDSLTSLHEDRQKQEGCLQAVSTTYTNMCFTESHGNLAKVFNKYATLLESVSGYKNNLAQLDLKYLVSNTKDILAWLRGSSLVYKKAILNSMDIEWQKKILHKKEDALQKEEMSASARKIGELKSQIVGIKAVITAIQEAQETLLSNLQTEMRTKIVLARVKQTRKKYLAYLQETLAIEQKILALYEEFSTVCQQFSVSG